MSLIRICGASKTNNLRNTDLFRIGVDLIDNFCVLYFCIIVLLYYRIFVLSYYRIIVLSYYRIIVKVEN